ncbi:MAG TPA: FAD-dependent oxidoreductase [Vicinamibacteria bacterium]|nr:FAD-dependent oxidoreductase [Vicinamibacteria bacterium]
MIRDVALLAGREHDVLVIGGGVCGAFAVWDAAQRGLRAALVEGQDFASGTSWNSMKTIHGGLRHLQRGDLAAVRESAREQRVWRAIAPELVRPLPFLVPAYGHGPRGREAMALGLRLYQLVSASRSGGRVLSREEVTRLVPGLSQAGLSGGVSWTDAQLDSPERLVLSVLAAATAGGAMVANWAAATGLLRCQSRVVGVAVRDEETGGTHEVRARCVLNASGPAVEGLARLAGAQRRLPLVRGMNLVLRRRIVAGHAIGARAGGRYLVMVPWRDRTIVGTAYHDLESGAGVASFLREAAAAFPWAEIEARDVSLVHRGLVPGRATALRQDDVVIDHRGDDGVGGLVSVQPSKFTTARAASERAVDLVSQRIGGERRPCRTASTVLPVAQGGEVPLAERARRAVRQEMALRLTDAVLRRLDLGTAGPPAAQDVDLVLDVMAAERGWDGDRRARERRELDAFYEVPS